MVVEESLIKEIVKFGNGPLKNQLKAVEKLCENCDEICADKNVLLKLLQTFVKFLVSKNPIVQKEGAYFIMSISEKDLECTKAIIDSNNALSNLVNLLSSSNPQVLEQALMCLGNIAADFPEEIVQANVLQPLTHCLNSNPIESIIKEAAILLRNISDIQQNILQIVASGSIEPLINLLDSKTDRKIVEQILLTLFNIISFDVENCNIVLDHPNISKAMNQLLNRVGAIKLLASQFIEKAISYGAIQTGKIIDESIIPILIKQINSGTNNDEIKINLVKIIKIIIKFKPEFIDSMININIVSILSNILGTNCDDNLIIAVLSTLNDIIHAYGYEKIEQKLRRCGTKMKVQKLLDHGNEEIRGLSSMIFDFVGDYNIPRGRKSVKRKISESNDQQPPTKIQRNSQSVRSALLINKRNKISMDQTDTEQSASPIENEMYGNDFDEQLSRNSTPINFDNESTLNNVSRKPSPAPPIVLAYPGDTTISINNALQYVLFLILFYFK
uniref:Uncharacterized protein n=1 Tax=Panagrolaimus davidi TaxID=227884 RepID=A0A914QRX8_9BILA